MGGDTLYRKPTEPRHEQGDQATRRRKERMADLRKRAPEKKPSSFRTFTSVCDVSAVKLINDLLDFSEIPKQSLLKPALVM